VAAPSGGMTLALLGAEVIRFDAIGGGIDHKRWPLTRDGHSIYWASLNKGKKSIAVDIRSDEGRDLLTAMIATPGPEGGIFLSNFPARGWMAYDSLREARNDLIIVNLTGNSDGSTALDYTVNCAVGYPDATGPSIGNEPINHVLPAWDLLAGQQAALAVLAAERYRARTGLGQLVKLSLADIALMAVSNLGHIGEAQINGAERSRYGNDVYGAYGHDFATSDGRRVMVVGITTRQWASLLAATETAVPVAHLEKQRGLDFGDEGQRFEARHDITAILTPWFTGRTMAQAGVALDRHDVCWGPYQSFQQLVAEDRRCSTDNPMFEVVDHPQLGEFLMNGSALNFSHCNRVPVGRAPLLGEHTDEILGELLGLGEVEIGRLHDRGIVAGVN
ncbi:MAG: CoA transferase, partial [Acidimicrobiales bacterium]